MARINFDETFNIYLFNYGNDCGPSSKLNEFLSFLKFNKVQLPYKFSFVSSTASLIPEMTLNENILIDFTANSLTESKVGQFQDFLKHQDNRALEKLYDTIILPNEYPGQSDAQMNKVCSLLKSLLFEGQFLFLEGPEEDLDPQTLNVFIEALKSQMKLRPLNVFLYSKDISFWLPHAHCLVERTKDFSFSVSQIESTKHSWTTEREDFYRSREIPSTLSTRETLFFKIPASKQRKSSAA